MKLWYDEPAENTYAGWFNYSLPIGNSAIGGNVFGRYDTERITLNEKTFWTGGPSESRPDYIGGNLLEKGKNGEALKEIQNLFLTGTKENQDLAIDKCGTNLIGAKDGYGGYQLLGNLYLEFNHSNTENYHRNLDIISGIATVGYHVGDTRYGREYFTSYKDNVMVIRLTASGSDKLSFKLSMSPENTDPATRSCITTGNDTELCIYGEIDDNQLKYNAFLKVSVSGSGARSQKTGDALQISGAEEVIILLSMATDYKNDYPEYRTGESKDELALRVRGVVETAAEKTYDELRDTHVTDFSALMNRVKLDIGQVTPDIPTDKLLNGYKAGTLTQQERIYAEVIRYQYGRYLLISSSRGGTLPANLQGLWVGKNGNPWASDYHLNINLQMNYLPAYASNLSECALPLVAYIESLREPGRVTAEIYFGVKSDAENPENGFTAHTQNTPFGWTCPGWCFSWGWSPAALPWILQNVWEYYEYTCDEGYLREHIYPMLKEEAVFYKQIMRKDEYGKWFSTPAYSPEHGPYTNGNTYEQTLIWQLFTDAIKAGEIVDEDETVLAEWRDILNNLRAPIELGTDGQVKEWYEETTLGSISANSANHRHMSHLLGLYPGNLITQDTPEWFDAARVSLEDRVDNTDGWAMVQRIGSWARLGDGDRAYDIIGSLLSKRTFPNMWGAHSSTTFQIDGSFGYTAVVNEMLLQSHADYIQPLPAIPIDWKDGAWHGLMARGNFETDAVWEDCHLQSFTLRSGSGNTCMVRYPGISTASIICGGQSVPYNVVDKDTIQFGTTRGGEYIITDIV